MSIPLSSRPSISARMISARFNTFAAFAADIDGESIEVDDLTVEQDDLKLSTRFPDEPEAGQVVRFRGRLIAVIPLV
jgi:hypothetical protein